ncbi:MAG: nucleotidyltransferase family protein [Planctomycetota bacterium]|jgi:hypothetical protein
MSALDAVSKLQLPQWCIGAGIIRSIVFDYLQKIQNSKVRDLDVAYFDSNDLSKETDKSYESLLRQEMPGIPWEVTNQAGVHLWYHLKFGFKVAPLISIEDAISTWPETCTSIGVTKSSKGDIKVIAPYGLYDLFNMVIRRNPKRIDIKTYNQRIIDQEYSKTWRSVKIIHEISS